MAPLLSIDVDSSALIAAMERLGVEAERLVKAAAKETAERIAMEATARIARRTGRTAGGITVEETYNGDGYVVLVRSPDMPGLPGWIEFGTKFQTAKPYLFPSARLEEGPHMRRVEEALQDAIDEQGLGS